MGIVAELLLEAATPRLARRIGQVWWIDALRRAPAVLLLLPVWGIALGVAWWAAGSGFASGAAALLFVALPAVAAAITVWRIAHPSPWRRSGKASG